jgi:hypothetical protein
MDPPDDLGVLLDRIRALSLIMPRGEEGRADQVLGHASPELGSAPEQRIAATKARSAPAIFAPPICRRSRRNQSRTERTLRHSRFVGSDEDGGYPANIAINTASLASEAINWNPM